MKKRIFTLLSTLLFSSAYVFPQTWNGSVSSDWNTAANWTPNGVPASAGNVIINNGSAAHHPVLTGDVSIASLNMSAGILNLNSHTLTCSGNASFTGDSLLNGTVVSPSFTQVTKMRMGGKIIFDKTGSDYNYWNGDNKVYGDSLIVIWRGGTLYLENADADSIFTDFKIRLINGAIVAAQNNLLYVKNNMILDNSGGGQIDFAANPGSWTIINGNLVGQNFLGNTSDLSLRGVETKGNNLNGPFYCYNGTVTTCSFHGDFSLVADSSGNGEVYNSSFFGTNNLFQAGNFGSFISNEFSGTSIIRIANNSDYTGGIYEGSNKYFGNVQFEADATNPDGSTRIIHSLGQDSCFGNLSFSLKNNSSLFANNLGQSYVAGNVTIDAQGAAKWIEFSGNSGATFTIGGNFTVKNFNSLPAPEAPISKVILHNLYVSGSDTVGTFYCSTGDIDNSRFNGNFKLIADSSQAYFINNSSFSGADNLFQAGITQAQNSTFGKIGPGTTILRSALNSGSNNMRDGNNKFYNNAQWETYAAYPENVIIQQNFFGADSCWGDMTYLLKGNSALTTNGNGNNYVAGNVIIDGQGARKWVEFGGGAGNTFTVGGNFTVKNFTPLPIPGITITNVYLRNLYVSGTDTVGTFYCTSGDINGSSFNGNFKLIADSAQAYFVSNSSFLGANNLFQAGIVETQNNKFGQAGAGTTILRSALSSGSNYMRDGNNKFFNNMQWETYAAYPGNVTIQQTFYGADSCWGNMNFVLKGNSGLTTNGNGHNYVSGNVTIDGQGARKWVEFGGGAGNTFTVGGNFTVKNFTPLPIPGITITNVYLRNLYVSGTDTVGTFYCTSGDINGSSFNGNFKLIADSAQTYFVSNSSFLGANNLFQAGIVETQNNKFGQAGAGTTILRSALSSGSNYMRDGNNKFFNNMQWETYAAYPGNVTIQQTFYGADSCWGNMNFVLKGNSGLTTNGNGHNYVSGNVTIDGQGARKWVEFGGGAGNTFTVGGNFTVKNFTPFSEPGVGSTNVFLRNLYVAGSDTVGTFYCSSGDINGSSFNGNFKLIADSSQGYFVSNSSFSGENNLFQAGIVETQNNKFGQPGTGTTILKSALSSGANNMRDGNNKFFGDAQWIAVAPSGGAILIQQTFFGPDTCLGNLTINLSGPASAGLGGNNLYIGKGLSLVNNGSGVIVHDNGVTAIHFIGTDTANYSFSGSGSSPSFINIEMNRKGGLKLMSPLTYTGSLVFTRGIIQSSLPNSLQIPNGAVVSSAWDSSYVDGPVQKTGNSAFTFPLGKNNVYAPISITAPSSATDAFTAQYFNHSAHLDGYDSSHVLGLIDHISRNEYWMLNRTAGTSSAKVTLSWKTARSGVVNKMTDLTVAHWDGSNWKDEGNGSTTGTNSEGTILSDNTISSFSPFTLASISISNPLPLRYISFVAQLNTNLTVLLQWETAEEENNDHFEIERSKDGNNWVRLGSMFPHSSHKYAYTDLLPEDGLNCYRIKEVDKDGKYFYSEIKFVRIGRINEFSMWPNPASDNLFVQIPFTGGTVELSDISGRLIGKYSNTGSILIIPVRKLNSGVYILKIVSEKEKIIRKFIKE